MKLCDKVQVFYWHIFWIGIASRLGFSGRVVMVIALSFNEKLVSILANATLILNVALLFLKLPKLQYIEHVSAAFDAIQS